MNILAEMSNTVLGFVIFALFIVLVIFIVIAQFLGLYVRAYTSGARVSLFELIGMRLRQLPALGRARHRDRQLAHSGDARGFADQPGGDGKPPACRR